ncbi:CYTH and CHAD domain-containing protein [Duganella sp. FT3S]|uniref:CYTH and CHAD domain-containing protein n=2 Tax=Rugamonas fusca TaxID=2758568 RepID=A0A7W2EFX9_9BURK|nr:CYTH and CHAD domain-containing protein [Rugamonas fusca]
MEVELKLLLDPADNGKLVRHPLLAAHARARQRKARLTARYFDTPGLHLLRHGAGLRVRQVEGQWIQTMKAGGSVQGGLHARLEWEGPVPDELPRLGKLRKLIGDDAHWLAVLDAPGLRQQLAPLFSVEVERSTWELDYDGSIIELVLDEGHISRQGRHLPINEIELELKAGHPASLFACALGLLDSLPLQVSNVNKAERGYALCLERPLAAVKAAPLTLARDATTGQALQAVLANCLRHMQDNEAAVIHGHDSESLHQLRVGTRRLRSALRLFDACAPCPAALLADLAWLGQQLGAARDWDVLATATLPRAQDAQDDTVDLAPLRDHLIHAAHTRRRAAAHALQSPRYARLMLGLNLWLQQLQLAAISAPSKHNPLARPAATFARRTLGQLHRKLLRRAATARKALSAGAGAGAGAPATSGVASAANELAGDSARDATARAVHRLRIAGKRCRYGVEFFASLLRPGATRRYLDHLSAMQDELGRDNDLVVAERLLRQCQHDAAALGAALPFARGYLHALRVQDASALHAACDAVRSYALPKLA